MRTSIKYICLSAAGLLLGGASASVLTARHYNNMLESVYVATVFDNVQMILDIRRGKEVELGERLERVLPQHVKGLEQLFGVNEVTLPALQIVRNFYADTSAPIPKELQPILEKLPSNL